MPSESSPSEPDPTAEARASESGGGESSTAPASASTGPGPAAPAPDRTPPANPSSVKPLTIALGVIAIAFLVLGGFYVSNSHTKRAVLAFILAAGAIAATVYTFVATRDTSPSR
jgi:hypothetical protein